MNESDIGPKKERLKILVVEDDSTVGELVKGTLEDMGHETVWKTSAEEALRTLASTPEEEDFDVIYLDIQLPKLDGIEFCRMCREYKHPLNLSRSLAGNAWIVAMTSLSHLSDVIEMLSTGANDYITKPVTPKIIEVKTTVCRFATERNRAFRTRIKIMEQQLVQMQRIQLGMDGSPKKEG